MNEPILAKAISEGRRTGRIPITNKTDLPKIFEYYADELYNAYPHHDDDTFSVTSLEKSDKQWLFEKTCGDMCPRDVQDCLPLLDGTAVHKELERIALEHPDEFIPEERIEMPLCEVESMFIPTEGGEEEVLVPQLKLSGGFDLLEKKTKRLVDYKNVKQASVDKNFSDKTPFEERNWKNQLTAYNGEIKYKYGFKPSCSDLVARVKDHSHVRAMKQPDYPQYACQQKIWEITEEDISLVFGMFKYRAQRRWLMLMGKLPVPNCSKEDTWRTCDFALMKTKDDKRAYRTFDSWEEANEMRKAHTEYRIYKRFGEPVNCLYYCPFSSICEQNKKIEQTHPTFIEDVTDGEMPF